jgi:hypothetical protein
MQQIEEVMFWRMENAKRGGFEAVQSLLRIDKSVAEYFVLVKDISQQKHDEVFIGKIKTVSDLVKGNAMYRYENPQAKTYAYLIRESKTDEKDFSNYIIDTIFI